jgi:hypothetical protein
MRGWATPAEPLDARSPYVVSWPILIFGSGLGYTLVRSSCAATMSAGSRFTSLPGSSPLLGRAKSSSRGLSATSGGFRGSTGRSWQPAAQGRRG